jgi:hypothetical protein
VLQQQWKNRPAGEVKKLFVSQGFSYVWQRNPAADPTLRDVQVNGKALDPEHTYTVIVNSFLAEGGDGFTVFKKAGDRALLVVIWMRWKAISASTANRSTVSRRTASAISNLPFVFCVRKACACRLTVLQTPGEIRAFFFVPRCSLCSYPHSRFRTARLSADDRSIAVLKSAKQGISGRKSGLLGISAMFCC